jgi:prepilin-type N-terminal cleavage/methylation domain-containing protein
MTHHTWNAIEPGTPASGRQRQAGFTVIELMIVMAVGVTLVGMAMMSSGAALSTFKARGVLAKLQSTIVMARETAVSQQRDVRIDFVGTNQINLVRLDKPSGTTTLTRVTFEGGLIYTKVAGLPDPTQDAWGGNLGAIAFDPATSIQFRAGTGVLMDSATLQAVNGRVFVGVVGKPETAGYVSIFGATGRVRSYHWEGQWVY